MFNFYKWLFEGGTKTDSYGNGAAMRVSACGLVARNIEDTLDILQAELEEESIFSNRILEKKKRENLLFFPFLFTSQMSYSL